MKKNGIFDPKMDFIGIFGVFGPKKFLTIFCDFWQSRCDTRTNTRTHEQTTGLLATYILVTRKPALGGMRRVLGGLKL